MQRTLADFIQSESHKYPGDDRPILIGQAPSRHGDPTKPLTGLPGRRLARLANMYPLEFYASVVRANLLPFYLGGNDEGDAFPMSEARVAAFESAPSLDGRVVVFVGRKVAEAFGFTGKWFEWRNSFFTSPDVSMRCAVIPHPSARNRWWNDEANVRAAESFLRELVCRESAVSRLRALRERSRAIEERRTTTEGPSQDDRGADRLPRHSGIPNL